jgi:hypothetical protein
VVVVDDTAPTEHDSDVDVAYEVLCRQHLRRRLTSTRATAVALSGAAPLGLTGYDNASHRTCAKSKSGSNRAAVPGVAVRTVPSEPTRTCPARV